MLRGALPVRFFDFWPVTSKRSDRPELAGCFFGRGLARGEAPLIFAARCRWLLQSNSKQPFFVEAPRLGAKRLSLANQRPVSGNSLHKGFETPVGIDVIDDDRSAQPQNRPGTVHLKANVLFTVQAIMNK